MRGVFAAGIVLALAGCGGGSSPSAPPVAQPAPTPTPTPTPSETPAPVPSPRPTFTPDGQLIVAIEGDSISELNPYFYGGLWKASHPEATVEGFAVYGSTLEQMTARIDRVLALKPDLVSIFIGANGLYSAPSVEGYLADLKLYADRIHAAGAKVVVCTVLPQAGEFTSIPVHNERRKQLATLMRQADWIDGLVDFAAEPEMGPDEAAANRLLYQDGVHPTNELNGVGEGGHRKLLRYYAPVMDSLLRDRR